MGKMMRMRFNDVVRLPEFDRDLKKLLKRYRTLGSDLEILVNTAVFLFHKVDPDYPHVSRIDDLGELRFPVYKVRRFACRSMKGKGGNTGLRLIYAYDAVADRVHLIEIYKKSDKGVEDRKRILKHLRIDE